LWKKWIYPLGFPPIPRPFSGKELTFPQVVEKCVEKISFAQVCPISFVKSSKIPQISTPFQLFEPLEASGNCGKSLHRLVENGFFQNLSTESGG
jgi:hypothetical protein